MNANRYNYSYTNRIGNALTEPFYQLYKADTKYLDALDVMHKSIAKVIYNSINMLLLNIVAIPLSLPLWFIGKAIVQYTSPKLNYPISSIDTTPLSNETLIKINLLNMVRNHKETVIKEVFSHKFWGTFYEFDTISELKSSRATDNMPRTLIITEGSNSVLLKIIQNRIKDEVHGSWFALYDHRKKYRHMFEPGLEGSKATDSIPFLERQMILTKFKDSNRLVEDIQKKINSEIFDNDKDVTALKRADLSKSNIDDYLVTLVSKNHKLPLKEASDFVATNFYSDNNITYQGANCLLQGIGVLS